MNDSASLMVVSARVPDIARDRVQREYVRGLTALTRAIDPTRPVVSNDGWEHVDSDILTIHDYATDPAVLDERYRTKEAARLVAEGMGPQARVMSVNSAMDGRTRTAPIMVSEFGGTSFSGDRTTWGYSLVNSAEEFEALLRAQFAALSPAALAGFCYTQLADTFQETNGLLAEDRRPKLPVHVLREIVGGPRGFTWPPPV